MAVRDRVDRLNPSGTVLILDLLHHDPTEYVRRPVTHHLADLARQDPQLAVRTAACWLERPDDDLRRLVEWGLRRLVRQRHPDACRLLVWWRTGQAWTAPRKKVAGCSRPEARIQPSEPIEVAAGVRVESE